MVVEVARMDFETSFDEYSIGESAKRFIALEVSDHEDDYNSSVDSFHESNIGFVADVDTERVSQSAAVAPTLEHASITTGQEETGKGDSVSVASTSGIEPPLATSNGNSAGNIRPHKDEKKRWSFISTNSSSKKRWSTLSFVSDTKSNKRLSVVSTESSSKRSSVQSLSKQSSTNKLKRSQCP